MKDLVLISVALWTLGDSLETARGQRATRLRIAVESAD